MLKLKKSELLDLRGLRRLCRLRTYDVLEVHGRKVVLNCVHHSTWEDTQLRVIAGSAECPACGKTRPHGIWSFSAADWSATLKDIQPHIKYIDKRLVVEGRTLYKHKCRKCKAILRHSISALLHKGFKCPECKYTMSEQQIKSSNKARTNLKATRKAVTRARDKQYYLFDLSQAYSVLKDMGVVKYPPQIDVRIPEADLTLKTRPPAKSEVMIHKDKTPIKGVESQDVEVPDIEDSVVRTLKVQVDVTTPLVFADDPEEEPTEIELSDDPIPLMEEDNSSRVVAVYASRNGQPPVSGSPVMTKKEIANYYGV